MTQEVKIVGYNKEMYQKGRLRIIIANVESRDTKEVYLLDFEDFEDEKSIKFAVKFIKHLKESGETVIMNPDSLGYKGEHIIVTIKTKRGHDVGATIKNDIEQGLTTLSELKFGEGLSFQRFFKWLLVGSPYHFKLFSDAPIERATGFILASPLLILFGPISMFSLLLIAPLITIEHTIAPVKITIFPLIQKIMEDTHTLLVLGAAAGTVQVMFRKVSENRLEKIYEDMIYKNKSKQEADTIYKDTICAIIATLATLYLGGGFIFINVIVLEACYPTLNLISLWFLLLVIFYAFTLTSHNAILQVKTKLQERLHASRLRD